MPSADPTPDPTPDLSLDPILSALPFIYAHMEGEAPIEAVGLVWSDGAITPLINQARSSERFTVSQAQFAEVIAREDPDIHTIYAIYHSHPKDSTTSPSPHDMHAMRDQFQNGFYFPWIIVTPTSGYSISWWDFRFNQARSKFFLYPESVGKGSRVTADV